MRFSLLFPVMLVVLSALTLMLGNVPAEGVSTAPVGVPGAATVMATASAEAVDGEAVDLPHESSPDRAVEGTTEARAGESEEALADVASSSTIDDTAPTQPDAAGEPAEPTGPPAEQPPTPGVETPAPAEETPAPAPETPASTTDLAAAPLFFMPVDGVSVAEVPSSFGDPRGSDRLHEGIDIMAERGTPVRAAAPGTVRRVTNSARGGLSVTIIGDDGLRYFYTHFDSFPPGLATGQRVGLDTVIGYVGNSGNASATAPHLHFGVYRPIEGDPYSWQAFDPLPFLIDRLPAAGE